MPKRRITGVLAQPIHWPQQRVKTDTRKLFEVLTKSVIMLVAQSYWNAGKELAGVFGVFERKTEASNLAYQLVMTALINAIHELASEQQHLFNPPLKDVDLLYDNDDYVQFLDGITGQVVTGAIEINNQFFAAPENSDFIQQFKTDYFKPWLELVGLTTNAATSVSNRLTTYFLYQLHDEWRKNATTYNALFAETNTPFSDSIQRALQWEAYTNYLRRETERPVFVETFGLRSIFIPLRAYYQRQKITEIKRRGRTPEKQEIEKIVDDAQILLNNWLHQSTQSDYIKIISGGPGSGKSSLAKMWAADVAEAGEWKVIFIPLHLFDLKAGLAESVGDFLRTTPDIPLNDNPLEHPQANDKLLLIFDGLDELSMQGKSARTAAENLLEKLEKVCLRLNSNTVATRILIAGRPIAAARAEEKVIGKLDKVLYLLPYVLKKEEQEKYHDPQELLAGDQRHLWWNRFFALREIPAHSNLPAELTTTNFFELTKEPLLNYLVALSWSDSKQVFSEDTNINNIYKSLIKGVYERNYEQGRRSNAVGKLDFNDFLQILEEIAICAWHGGDVRVTSENRIEQHMQAQGLKQLLEEYKASVRGGVSRLLTAFYFRKHSKDEQSNEVFEFTHKSFGEYLTARALVNMLALIHTQRKAYDNRKNHRDRSGWSMEEALQEWLRIFGPVLLDEDLIAYIQREIANEEVELVQEWQQLLCRMIEVVHRENFTFVERYSHKEEIERSQNGKIGLMVMLGECAQKVREISSFNLYNGINFWEWHQKSYGNQQQYFLLIKRYDYLQIKDHFMSGIILNGASLKNSCFDENYMIGASMISSDLNRASLKNVNLSGSNLYSAIMIEANLREAIMTDANLTKADLSGANLNGVLLNYAILVRADLIGTDLINANLHEANLYHAEMRNSNLNGADLDLANLKYANLVNADLTDANGQEADFTNANLEYANLTGVNLNEAILDGAILTSTNLKNISVEPEQLLTVYSLKGCRNLDPELEAYVRKHKPELLE